MTIKEWREKYAQYGLPTIVAVSDPAIESNVLPDEFVPSLNDTVMGRQLLEEAQPGQFDGIKIADMRDPQFAAARFAPNNLARIDASVRYQREFVGNYQRVTASLKAGKK